MDAEVIRNLAYHPALHMVVGESTDVEIQLTTGNVVPVISGTSPTTIIHISTTCQVEARLFGAPGTFDIAPSEDYQAATFVASQSIPWEWAVTPLQPGKALELDFQLESIFQAKNGTPLLSVFPPFQASISVAAASRTLLSRTNSVANSGWFDTLLGVLAAALLTALGTLARYIYRKRHRKNGSNPGAHKRKDKNGAGPPPEAK